MLLANEGVVGSDVLAHLLLNSPELFVADGIHVEVVVKSVLHRRADGRLGVGKQFGDGLCEQVGAGVAQDVQPFIGVAHNGLYGTVRIDNVREVTLDFIDKRCHSAGLLAMYIHHHLADSDSGGILMFFRGPYVNRDHRHASRPRRVGEAHRI